MDLNQYLADPCRASSLPFWKTECFSIPEQIAVVRDDEYSAFRPAGRDEPYFKLKHDLKIIRSVLLPDGFALVRGSVEVFARHINSCYSEEHLSAEELSGYAARPVYRPELWIAVADASDGTIAASGIAELDSRIGEGILEWIQVSPGYRRRGLGSFVVCELLRRMQNTARFATVSGRLESECRPIALYQSCGFTDPVIWHVVSK